MKTRYLVGEFQIFALPFLQNTVYIFAKTKTITEYEITVSII